MTGLRVPGTALKRAILAGIALLLLTPFVVTPGTVFPFVVGKALWSRSLIEIVFALWAVLALARPAYRPPRSWLLLVLGAGLAVSLLSACFGVSLQRSLWSSYERMQGVIDGAHWVALAVVLASVLRSAAAWRTLLGFNAGAATAMACIVIARHYEIHVPFFSAIPEPHLPRMSGPFGNPTYLSVCMLFNLLLALGFAVRAWLPGREPALAAALPVPARRGGQGRRRREAPATPDVRRRPRWPGALAWTLAAALLFWGLALAGSVGGIAGLFAAVAFVAVAGALLGRGRTRRVALAATVLLCVAAVAMGLRFFEAERTARRGIDHPVAGYVAGVHLQRPGVQSRLAAWEAGIEGFAARPVLGWGPENFTAVFGRFASGYGAVAEPHDQAHGKLVEVAATAGALGLAAYLALWAAAFGVLWRAARGMAARERTLAVFAGAALLGVLTQGQFLFDTVVGSLQTMLLLGFVVSLEGAAVPERHRPRLPDRPWSWQDMGGGIDGFRPLANTWRWWLFNEIERHWPAMRADDGARARRLLDWAGRQAEEAVRAEPAEWRIRQSLARMYRAAAATDPGYEAAARRHLERARALAPNRAVFRAALEPPGALAVRRLDDGRHELTWRPSPGAGYHAVAESRYHGPWRHVFHGYDPARPSFVPPGTDRPGVYRYRIKACRYPGDCSTGVAWPPVAVPGGAPAARPGGRGSSP